MRHEVTPAAAWVTAILLATPAAADEPRERALEFAREVESPRAPARLIETPLAISVVEREEIVRDQPAVDLEEALDLVPGVFAQSARNFAQDTRVSIRGFGARAPFGIRGITVLVDGVPTTLADGQSEVDSIDLAFVDRIEAIRGPVSSLYGGGGGGVLEVRTLSPTERPEARLRTTFGTDHLSRYEALARGSLGGTGYLLGLGATRASGYRDHSRGRQSVLLGKLERELEGGTQLGLQVSSVWAPEAQDPGGLDAARVAADRTQALDRARRFDAGERLNQQRVVLSARRAIGEGTELRAHAYRVWRDFRNALPFNRRVDLKRRATGGSLVYTGLWRRARWTGGLDVDVQQDVRRNHDNLDGARGPLTLRQSETVVAVGPFLETRLDLPSGLGLVAGARYDWTEFDVGDRFVAGAGTDASDTIRFRELSPRVGVHYGRSPAFHAWLNYATAFQVPTTVELRPPDADGGFDRDREPERAAGLELGVKGLLARLAYELVLFDLRVRDALVPFEDAGGETFFRNAGVVRRRGAELAVSADLGRGLSLRAGYTYADYRYRDFDPSDPGTGALLDLDGNREPNTPRHSLGAELRLDHPSGLYAALALRHFSDIEVDDRNTAESAGATLSDVRLGWTWDRGDTELRPFLGVRNWTKAEYDGTLRPNAAFNRYFEPAAEVEVYAGFEVRFAP